VIRVRDTGRGIEEEHLGRIFEPFYSAKHMRTGRSGTGLGLAIVHRIVRDHSGYINVTSEKGSGTEFALYFPVLPVRTYEKAPRQKDAEALRGSGAILVVDDVKEQLYLSSRVLRDLGYDVVTASSGREALEFFQKHDEAKYVNGKKTPFDLVMLDMVLGEGADGLDAYEEIVKVCPEQKCIIVSGYSETDRVRRARELGAGRFVSKPFTLEKLGSAVRAELDK
jgi:CheY-like chemotaxis protein